MHALHLPPHPLWRATLLAALAAAAVFLAMTPPDLGNGSGSTTEYRAVPGPLPPPAWISEPLTPPTAQLAP